MGVAPHRAPHSTQRPGPPQRAGASSRYRLYLVVGPGEVLPAENAARGRDLSEQAVHSAAAHPLRDPLFGRALCMVEQTVCLKLVYLSTIIWLIRMAEDVGLWGYFKV